MPTWKTVCQCIVVALLLCSFVPIRVKGPNEENNEKLFVGYMKQFNKSYEPGSEEYQKRYEAFKTTLSLIDEYNANRPHNATARYGLTKYSDLTQEEFIDRHLDMAKRLGRKHRTTKKPYDKNERILTMNGIQMSQDDLHRVKRALIDKGVPLKVDWRDKGVISPVKNQGLCGACWAYSTIQMAEAMAAIRSSNLTLLSIQQMIDCARNGNYGCLGGDICSLLEWLTVYGITIQSEVDYPLNTKKDPICHLERPPANKGFKVLEYSCGSLVGKETVLLQWLAKGGPSAVAINALSWQNYLGGVIQYHCSGEPTSLNHAVQIIGYDLTAEIPHYIAKNSWGANFGNQGYIYLAIGGNMCGLANEVSMMEVMNAEVA